MSENGTAPLLISIVQAGKLLGVGRGLAYQLAREGKMPTIWLGGRRMVSRQHLEAWIEQEVGANADHGVLSGQVSPVEPKEE